MVDDQHGRLVRQRFFFGSFHKTLRIVRGVFGKIFMERPTKNVGRLPARQHWENPETRAEKPQNESHAKAGMAELCAATTVRVILHVDAAHNRPGVFLFCYPVRTLAFFAPLR
jgi:hypothetical protein